MAEKRIERKDLVAQNAITEPTKELLEMEAVLLRILKEFDLIVKSNPLKSGADVKKYNTDVKAVDETIKTLNKTREKLTQSMTAEGKTLAELRVLQAEQNKANKEAAKEALGLVDAYQKQSKRLNQLRKDYKALAVSEGKSTKETRKLLKEINKLDKELKDVDESVGQFQRNVGNYPKVVGDASKSLLKLGAAALTVSGAFNAVNSSLEKSAEGSENTREFTSALSGVFSQVANVVSATALDVFDYGKAVVESVQGGGDLIESLKNTEGQFERTGKATDNFVEKVRGSINAEVELTDKIIAFEKAIRPLQIQLVSLNSLIEQQQIIAGDSTRSFDELNEAVLKGQELQIQRASVNIKIAKQELEIASERVRIAQLAGGAGVDVLNAQTEAVIKLKEAENALKNEVLENDKELRQIKQDRLERDLDILIDGFDNQKTINERIIANEKETLEARAALFEKTVDLANKSFESQKKVLADLSNAGIDVDALLALDATALQERIRTLEQSEIIEGRTLEVIRERRTVLQDLEDAQNDLNDSEIEAIALRNDILIQQKKLADSDFDLEKARTETKIAEIQVRLEAVKEGSIEELRLNKELNDLLLEQDKEAIDKEAELKKKADDEEKKRKEENVESFKKAITGLSDAFERASQKRIEELDKEQSENEKALERQERRAEQGLSNTLAFEQQKQAELEKKREEEQKKQERRQKATLLFNSVAEFSKDDPNSALAKGVALTAATELVAGFFEDGAERIGDHTTGSANLPGRDNIIIGANKEERMFGIDDSLFIRSKLGNISNSDLIDLAINGASGSHVMAMGMDTSRIEAKLDDLGKIMQSNGVNIQWNGLEERLETRVINGVTKKTTHKRGRL